MVEAILKTESRGEWSEEEMLRTFAGDRKEGNVDRNSEDQRVSVPRWLLYEASVSRVFQAKHPDGIGLPLLTLCKKGSR